MRNREGREEVEKLIKDNKDGGFGVEQSSMFQDDM